MDTVTGSIIVVAIVCYTIYEICALIKRPTKFAHLEGLKTLKELEEKGVITQEEFDKMKINLLDDA